MGKSIIRTVACCAMIIMIAGVLAMPAYSEGKIGYVDLRRAFYEYEKAKTLEKGINDFDETSKKTRTKMVQDITKMRDEGELLSGKAREKKQSQIEQQIAALQEFDRTNRQESLNKKNDMYRQVIDDIQKVVEDIGKKEGYDYVLDSRNIMYANKSFDLTDQVVKVLNKR